MDAHPHYRSSAEPIEKMVMEAFGFDIPDDSDNMDDIVDDIENAYATTLPDFIDVYEYNVHNGNMMDEGRYMWGYWERHVVDAQTFLMCIDQDNTYTGKIYVAEKMSGGNQRDAFRDDLHNITNSWNKMRGEIYQSPDFPDFKVFIDYNDTVVMWLGSNCFPYARKWFPNTFGMQNKV